MVKEYSEEELKKTVFKKRKDFSENFSKNRDEYLI